MTWVTGLKSPLHIWVPPGCPPCKCCPVFQCNYPASPLPILPLLLHLPPPLLLLLPPCQSLVFPPATGWQGRRGTQQHCNEDITTDSKIWFAFNLLLNCGRIGTNLKPSPMSLFENKYVNRLALCCFILNFWRPTNLTPPNISVPWCISTKASNRWKRQTWQQSGQSWLLIWGRGLLETVMSSHRAPANTQSRNCYWMIQTWFKFRMI